MTTHSPTPHDMPAESSGTTTQHEPAHTPTQDHPVPRPIPRLLRALHNARTALSIMPDIGQAYEQHHRQIHHEARLTIDEVLLTPISLTTARPQHTPPSTQWSTRSFGETIQIDGPGPNEGAAATINPTGNSNAGIPSRKDWDMAARILQACNHYLPMRTTLEQLTQCRGPIILTDGVATFPDGTSLDLAAVVAQATR